MVSNPLAARGAYRGLRCRQNESKWQDATYTYNISRSRPTVDDHASHLTLLPSACLSMRCYITRGQGLTMASQLSYSKSVLPCNRCARCALTRSTGDNGTSSRHTLEGKLIMKLSSKLSGCSATVHLGRRVTRQRRLRTCARADGEDRDLVTRIFGNVFGKNSLEEPEPMGLKRLSEEAAKELYPATTDEWAQPVEGDDDEGALLRPMLAQTSIEATPLRLAYDADRDGWSADAFHRAVNTFGAAVVVAGTSGGAIVGGYNPSGWIGLGEDRDSMAAFVFTWPDGDTAKLPLKLPKVGGAAQAVLDRAESGPLFGPDGLRIPLAASDPKQAFSKLGSYYARRPDGARNLFADGEEVKRGKGTQLVWLRTYVAEGGPETFELDGIIWKTSKAGE
eukprot:jgi/Ulvmu1/3929/UM018_0152.1